MKNYSILIFLLCLTMYSYHFDDIYRMVANNGVDLDTFALFILSIIISTFAFIITKLILHIVLKSKIHKWVFIVFSYIISIFIWLYSITLLTPIMNIS